MCLVEVNNNLGVSCALPLIPEMVVFTESLRVIQAREGVVEFLLVIILWIVLYVIKEVNVICRI